MQLATNVASLSGHMLCGTMLDVARERLVEAAAEFRRIEEELERARAALAQAIVEAGKAKMPQTEIIRISGYSREHVRRLLRDGGVEA